MGLMQPEVLLLTSCVTFFKLLIISVLFPNLYTRNNRIHLPGFSAGLRLICKVPGPVGSKG